MAKSKKKDAGKEPKRGGTSGSKAKKTAKPKPVKVKTKERSKSHPQTGAPTRRQVKPGQSRAKVPVVTAVITTTCPRRAVNAVQEKKEPFVSKGAPPPGGRLTTITRAQALFLLPDPVAHLLGDAQHFMVAEWEGLLPEGMPINGQELGDLDEEEGVARNLEGGEIGKFQMIDPADDNDAPYFTALIWY